MEGTQHPHQRTLTEAIDAVETDLEFQPQSVSEAENPFARIPSSHIRRAGQIWAIGGGKGGIGKSLISSSLAATLGKNGRSVTAVDLDLGGANLHTTLGVDLPKKSLSDFFSLSSKRISDCAVTTPIENLQLVSGAGDAIGAANISFQQKVSLIQGLREVESEFLLLDLGAGTSYHTLDFFLMADTGLIVILPEPTSIENAYRFIKSLYYRKLWNSPHLQSVKHLIEIAMLGKNKQNIQTPADLFAAVNAANPEAGIRMKEEIASFKPKLLINQARTQTDVDIGFSMKTVCKKYFGIDLDYIGYLDYDSAVWQSVRRKRPFILEFPNSRLVSNLERITQYLIKNGSKDRREGI